tara:strand:+ start:833 stop:1714 length:882 start_codon:yes stop_codon:yes gene_type:complete
MIKRLILVLGLFFVGCTASHQNFSKPFPNLPEPDFLFDSGKAKSEKAKSLLPLPSASVWLNEQLALPLNALTSDKSIFQSYQSKTRSTWNDNWLSRFDFSGVAWDGKRAGTLITRQHILFAKHYPRAKGSVVTFVDRNGDPAQRRVIKTAKYPGSSCDVAVGLLDTPVPSTVCYYPLLPSGYDWSLALRGAQLLVTDQQRKALFFGVSFVLDDGHMGSPESLSAYGNLGIPTALRERLVPGDSGHPSFLVFPGNQLVLVSTSHHGGLGMRGPFLGGDRVQHWIKAVLAGHYLQ